MMTKRSVVGSTAALLFALGVTSAHGEVDAERGTALQAEEATRSVVVRYTHEDLDRAEGRRMLHARLEAAARRACGPVEIKDFHARRVWKECYDAALADALDQVGSPRLAALQE